MLTGRPDTAADLAQAACLRAIERHEQFAPGTHVDRWLFTIARRLWYNELRSLRVRTGGGLVALDEVDLPEENTAVETKILASQVLREMARLPEAQRLAAVLVYVEGFRDADAAEILDVPVGTIMSRLAAARRRLNDALAAPEGLAEHAGE